MTSHHELATQLVGDIAYRHSIKPHVSEQSEGQTLANYLGMIATHVSRRDVDNRWCAPAQRAAFQSVFEQHVAECRRIAQLALAGCTNTAATQYAELLARAAMTAPGARSLPTAVVF